MNEPIPGPPSFPPREPEPACKTCGTARIFVNEDRSVFIVHGQAHWYFKAGTPEAEQHIRNAQANALGNMAVMAMASRKKGA